MFFYSRNGTKTAKRFENLHEQRCSLDASVTSLERRLLHLPATKEQLLDRVTNLEESNKLLESQVDGDAGS